MIGPSSGWASRDGGTGRSGRAGTTGGSSQGMIGSSSAGTASGGGDGHDEGRRGRRWCCGRLGLRPGRRARPFVADSTALGGPGLVLDRPLVLRRDHPSGAPPRPGSGRWRGAPPALRPAPRPRSPESRPPAAQGPPPRAGWRGPGAAAAGGRALAGSTGGSSAVSRARRCRSSVSGSWIRSRRRSGHAEIGRRCRSAGVSASGDCGPGSPLSSSWWSGAPQREQNRSSRSSIAAPH